MSMGTVDSEYECIIQIYPTDITLIANTEKQMRIEFLKEYENECSYRKWKSIISVEFIIDKDTFPIPNSVKFHVNKCSGVDSLGFIESLTQSINEGVEEISLFFLYSEIEQFQSSNTLPFGICPICLDPLNCSAASIQLPCYHYFHSNCIDDLKDSGADCVCPICRMRFACNKPKCNADFTKYYAMDDDIYNPLITTLSNYFILVKNSGITHSHHVLLSYFYRFSPLKGTYDSRQNGWIISFQYKEQAKSVINTFNGRSILPEYPPMEITEYIEERPSQKPGSPQKQLS